MVAGVPLHLELGLDLADLAVRDILDHLAKLAVDHLIDLLVLVTGSTLIKGLR